MKLINTPLDLTTRDNKERRRWAAKGANGNPRRKRDRRPCLQHGYRKQCIAEQILCALHYDTLPHMR